MTIGDVIRYTGAKPDRDVDPGLELTGISRNTQTLEKGMLFVPLRGERFDGHRFIPQAEEKGAAAVLCDERGLDAIPAGTDVKVPKLLVENTLFAVQAIAAGVRAESGVKVVGVTGSVGKTTTSEMIALALGGRHRLARTAPDMNGQVGLTFAILDLKDEDTAVWEMGMNMPGELMRLTKMARPDIAVINTIGTAHIGFFGTRERICKEKMTVAAGLPAGGTLVLNGDEPLLRQAEKPEGIRVLYFGIEDADVTCRIVEENADGSRFVARVPDGDEQEIFLPSPGRHNVQNALAAVAVGWLCGVPLAEIAEGLGRFGNVKGRQRLVREKGFVILEDCYNASPDAVVASLGVLKGLSAGQRFASLGVMLELGDYTAEGHRRCGAAAAACADWLCVYGDGCGAYLEGAREAGMDPAHCLAFADHESMSAFLKEKAVPGDALLFKGSRLTHMEKVLAGFLA